MDDLNDDFVARLLAKEATDRNISYHKDGLQALLPRRTTGSSIPKPNTRFLRNIVREADLHNAALRAKEAVESKSRLRRLQTNEDLDINRDRARNSSLRRARERAQSSGRPPRSHTPPRSPPSRRQHHRDSSRTTDRSLSPPARGKRKRKRSRSVSTYTRQNLQSRQKTHETRQRDSGGEDGGQEYGGREGRDGATRIKYHNSMENADVVEKRSRNKHRQSRSPSGPLYDSSDEFIGPTISSSLKARGRGTATATGSSIMDAHFKEEYDPSTDVRPNSEEEEWDNALEAYRDRQKWKSLGAERLRSAGFDETFITAWENNATKDETCLKWTQKGAVREWDRGKQLQDTGEVSLKPQWKQ